MVGFYGEVSTSMNLVKPRSAPTLRAGKTQDRAGRIILIQIKMKKNKDKD
jgi:hypothetical protein